MARASKSLLVGWWGGGGGGGGGLFDYSVSPGPFFWEFDTEFWVQSLDLDLGLDLDLDTGPDLELDNFNDQPGELIVVLAAIGLYF